MEMDNFYALLGPAVFALIGLEIAYCIYRRNGFYSFQDSLMGLGTMIIAQCVNVALVLPILIGYGWIYRNFGLFEIPTTWWSYAVCYLGVDFLFYWFHRAGHRVNILWAAHVPHHSAEELNYAVALRASLTQRLASFLFYWPLALVGFAPEVIIPIIAINLIIQLLPHTRVIPKLPTWIDSWLNTPYHHRIHHAANQIYWDRNYGGTFIFWDRMFGTFRAETEVPYYGVSIHPKSWDPTYLNFHWYIVLWKDAMAASHFIDKLKIWFMPPGWRPRNLGPYPKESNFEGTRQIKYQTKALSGSTAYLLFQAGFSLWVLYFIIDTKSPLDAISKTILSGLLYFSVTLWARILEAKRGAIALEFVRIALLGVFFSVLHERQVLGADPTLLAFGLLTISTLWTGALFLKNRTSRTGLGSESLQVSDAAPGTSVPPRETSNFSAPNAT